MHFFFNLLDKKISSKINIIDLIQSKPFPKILKSHLNTYKEILTIDEQTNVGSLGSLLQENIDKNING